MTLKLAYNTTDAPIVVEGGYVIGGRGWGTVDSTDPRAQAAYDAGFLVDADEEALGKSEHPRAAAAVRALEARREKVKVAQGKGKDELVEALDPDVVADLDKGGDGKPSKDDLVDAAVDTDADLEASTTKKKSTSSRTRGQK